MSALTLQNVPLISADSHVNEPPELWQENLPPHLRDRAPRAVKKEIVDGGTRSAWGEPFDSWSAGNLVGTPEQVCEKIQAYVDRGCTGFVPWNNDYPSDVTLRLFAEKVMPEFR